MKKPKKIKFTFHGYTDLLDPFHLPLKELLRVRDWLNRVIEWRQQNDTK